MKKYQKLYQLKQIVKAYQEYAKYSRLTRKQSSPIEYDKKYKEASGVFNDAIKDTPIRYSGNARLTSIAYTMLKGKKYSQIEHSVRKENELREYEWKNIVEIMKFFKDEENAVIIPESPFPTTKVNEPKKKVEVSNE